MEAFTDMPSQAQEFCLKWNNFQSSLVTAIDGFKNDLEFVDVTITCEGKLLKAHKMLLSACSIFFRDIFKDVTQYQHPVIILPGDVKFNDLEKILTFIYQGEVNVHQENLPRFLKTAEMLKIRGLAEDNEKRTLRSAISPKAVNKNSNPKRRKVYDGQSTSANDLFKLPVDDNSRHSTGDVDSDSEMVPVKQEMIELKEIDFESTDAETFIADALLKEVNPTPSSSNSTQGQSVPPPPGPLLPSYIPPAQTKTHDGMSRASSHPVGGLIRRFMEECLQLPDPAPLLATYSCLEGTPHFQLLRSVAKEWSYCRNATQNYTTLGGSNKRQRATSRLIETFEKIDSLRTQLAHSLHDIIIIEVENAGSVIKVCKAEQVYASQHQHSQHNDEAAGSSNDQNNEPIILDVEGISLEQQQSFSDATGAMKQLRKLYFDQSRRLAVRISQLKKGRQQSTERLQRHQLQQNLLQQTIQQFQHQQMQQQISATQGPSQPQLNSDGSISVPSHAQLALHLHQPWSE